MNKTLTETRVYGPVPVRIHHSLSDWICKQAVVEDYRYTNSDKEDCNSPQNIAITFKEGATSAQKARIGRTLARERMRRIKVKS